MSCLHVNPRWHGQPQCCITLLQLLLLLLCFEQQAVSLNPGKATPNYPPGRPKKNTAWSLRQEKQLLKPILVRCQFRQDCPPACQAIPRLRASMMLSGCGGHLRQGSTPLHKSDTWVCLCESCFLVKGNHNETNHLEAQPVCVDVDLICCANSYIRSKHQKPIILLSGRAEGVPWITVNGTIYPKEPTRPFEENGTPRDFQPDCN